MDSSRFPRGTVLLCNFPYDNNPHQPGPEPHFCLVVDAYEHEGKQYVAVCYGTSSFEKVLLDRHQGLVLTVGKEFIKGIDLPKGRGNFLADHVALLPLDEAWIVPSVQGRFDFIREKKREKDAQRARLYAQYLALEKSMLRATLEVLTSFIETGKLGLPQGKKLR